MLRYTVFACFLALSLLCFGQRKLTNLKITEIHYNPAPLDTIDGDRFEFFELKNVGDEVINFYRTGFVGDVQLYFLDQNTELAPGEFMVIARDSENFFKRYGFYPDKLYANSENKLNNSGSEICLITMERDTILYVKYKDTDPWPVGADGAGFSLVPVNANPDPSDYQNDPSSWRLSSFIDGTPGKDDVTDSNIPQIIVNEVAPSFTAPDIEFIELYNPTSEDVDISGWFISDNLKIPQKWAIPSGTVIASKGYVVFYEHILEGNTEVFTENEYGEAFKFSSYGEDAYLFSAKNGVLTGYVNGFSYGSSPDLIPTGMIAKSDGSMSSLFLKQATPGAPNAQAWVGPVAINKIHYSPVVDSNTGLQKLEFLALRNRTADTIELFNSEPIVRTWKIRAIDFEFPMGEVMYPYEEIYLVPDSIDVNRLYSEYNIPQGKRIFQYQGALNNKGESVELEQTQPAYFQNNGDTVKPEIILDKVNYDNQAPWALADSNNCMLVRLSLDDYGNDYANWIAVEANALVQYIRKGTNLIAFTSQTNETLSKLFPDFYSYIQTVKNNEVYYDKNNPDYFNRLTVLTNSAPYFIQSDKDFQFVSSSNSLILSQTIELKAGWNFVGISVNKQYSTDIIAQKLGSSLIEIKDQFYNYSDQHNTLEYLEGGRAYYFNMTKNTSLTLD